MNSNQPRLNEPPLAGLNILLVEDEPNAKELLCDILKIQGGARVNAVPTAREALELLVQLKPDILISNIVLPDEDGWELIQQVRSLEPEQGGQIPAIAVTAAANPENRTRLLKAGFQAYFFKPFETDELMQKIIDLVQLN